MFGIGFGELTLVLIVLLLVVGPDRMPTMLKAMGRAMREFQRASRELRNATGIDEMMRDESLKELKELQKLKNMKLTDVVKEQVTKPIEDELADVKRSTVSALNEAPRAGGTLGAAELEAEQPDEGVDLAHARTMIAAAAPPKPPEVAAAPAVPPLPPAASVPPPPPPRPPPARDPEEKGGAS